MSFYDKSKKFRHVKKLNKNRPFLFTIKIIKKFFIVFHNCIKIMFANGMITIPQFLFIISVVSLKVSRISIQTIFSKKFRLEFAYMSIRPIYYNLNCEIMCTYVSLIISFWYLYNNNHKVTEAFQEGRPQAGVRYLIG